MRTISTAFFRIITANITDRDGAVITIENEKENLSEISNILVDSAYAEEKFANQIKDIIKATVEAVKRNELYTFVLLSKCWVVERPFSWLEECCRLWKNCERKLNTSLQMVILAFLALLLKRF